MSTRRLTSAGIACLILSILTATAGLIAQLAAIGLGMMSLIWLIPVASQVGDLGPIALPIARILAPALAVAGLLLVAALACFVGAVYRARQAKSLMPAH